SLNDNINSNNTTWIDIIDNTNCLSPLELLLQKEDINYSKGVVSNLLSEDNNILTKKQKLFIKEFYLDDKNLTEIAKEYNISRQAVCQVIKKGLNNLKESYNVKS